MLRSSGDDPGEILLKQDVTVDSTLTSGTAQILSGGVAALAGSIDMNGGTRTWSVNNGSSGGAGNDSLTGGEGADFLTGEAGVDTFIYNALSEGSMSEQIGDWQGGIDKLQIDASAFGGGLAAGALAANRLVIGTMANQAFGQFLYNNANGVLYWDADGTGAGAATAFTRLFTTAFASPPATLAAADFLIVV